MAAGPWIFYNSAKKHLGDGTINLVGDTFQMSLFNSASNAADPTLELIAQLTSEVAAGFGYTLGGQLMAAVTWLVGATASEMRFSADPTIWTAAGGSIPGIRYAVIWANNASPAERKLMCCSSLEDTELVVTSGNTLTISPSLTGIFKLN